ncbi:inositol monophosphatase family protein [Dietzia timorensis]|uniref:Inositol-1-monophosphatase n=1 Tax=Dietzia timorensis TaxID=499555 RepID=A0A173LL75_9ACTN|nr:inositol monophosphatase family protein [Dietzia timorensis]ANI92334.1 Inositol-1-monophosphatase [Dietzia timorensis]
MPEHLPPPQPIVSPDVPSARPEWRPSARLLQLMDDAGPLDTQVLELLAIEITEHVGRVFRYELALAEHGDGTASRAEALGTQTKSTDVDPVTRIDTESEALIRRILAELRPQDAILGEEEGGRIAESGVTWIADPVDGTVNLLYALPLSVVSLGAVIDGEHVAGAVHALSLGDTYAARRGGGAWHRTSADAGWRPIGVSGREDLATALVATGFSYERDVRRQQGDVVARLLPKVRDIRRLGAAALDLCHLAAGRIDGYYERGIKVWDYAAGLVIAEEAGAIVELANVPSEPVVAAAPRIAAALSAEVRGES